MTTELLTTMLAAINTPIDPDLQATIPEALNLLWQGMLGIFIVAAIIIACASLFGVLTSKKKRKSQE